MLHNQNRPLLSAIVAMDKNRAIGHQNHLPWHLPADLKHFKSLTTHRAILMGRKTFESIGKPLPNRTNIILTRDANYQAAGCITVTSIDHAIQEALLLHDPNNEIFIIGGAEIYQQLLPHIQLLYLTIVHHTFEADAFFPALDNREWNEISREEHKADEQNVYDYTFLTLERIST
nr:Dihydrofolate reductase [uncultured bacterium]